MSGNLGNLYFLFEIIIAEVMFSYSYPKRKLFPLRAAIALVLEIATCYFLPTLDYKVFGMFSSIFRFVSMLIISIVGLFFCYNANPTAIISTGSASYALQHFSYKLTHTVRLIFPKMYEMLTPTLVTKAFIMELMVFPIPYIVAFFIFALPAAKLEYYKNVDWRFFILSLVTVAICTVLNRFTSHTNTLDTIGYCLYPMTCSALALVIQFSLQRYCKTAYDNKVITRVLQEKEKQYELSKNNKEMLYIKIHDLKYTINNMDKKISDAELSSLEKSINIYDSDIKTGCEAIDVIFTEKTLKCKEKGISITCFGNGLKLSFMDVVDIYSLFGNALDNAIEAVEKIEDSSKRKISITINNKADFTCISLTNYFTGNVKIENGIITTSKADSEFHGFGLKSMKVIAKKYGGDISVITKDDIFTLSIYLLNQN